MKACLMILFVSLLTSTGEAQKETKEKVKYYCAPCGCVNDGKAFDSGGKCPECGMRLLEVGTFNYEMPSISKNGIIVYVSNEPDNKQQLFYKNIHASSKAKLIAEGFSPQISADGKKILYSPAENKINLYDVEAGAVTELTAKINLPGLQIPVWSADNDMIFSAGKFPDVGIYKMHLDDGKVEPLITGEGLRYGCTPSPDGKKIAYRCVKGKTDKERQRGIAVYDLITKEEKYISGIGEYCTWSPDGRRLAFHWPDSTGFCIYTVNADGTDLKKIAGTKDGDYELPSWSADGNTIYFQTNLRHGNWEIWTMNTDGSNQKPLVWEN
jgi:Tol biopolymer transport system component